MRLVTRFCPPALAADRDDLVQNACIKLTRIAERDETSGAWSASYLWRTAHSAVMDEIRRRMRRPAEPLEDAPEPASPATAEADRAELGAAIAAGLQSLAEPRRRAVALHLMGYGLEESATMLGWDSKRLANMRYRGLEDLRTHLRERGYAP